MDTAEVLRTARNNLEGHWFQGYYGDGRGNMCSLGHIQYATGIDIDLMVRKGELPGVKWNDDVSSALKVLTDIIKEQYPEPNDRQAHVPVWNDAKERTEAEVIAVFEKAIAKAEETC